MKMNNNDKPDKPAQFFPNDSLDKELFRVEEMAASKPPYPERIPSGYEPMSEIQLRGRAFRSLATGEVPWWVLISGWIIFGGLGLLILIRAITSGNLALLPALAIISIPIIIVWRGTAAKLSSKKRKSRRR